MTTLSFPRDTILVAGPSACGKTKTLNQLREELSLLGIPYDHIPLTDSHTIMERMFEDDSINLGQGHYHPWCEGDISGHTHEEAGHEPTPFTLAGDPIARNMMIDFWKGLRRLPQDGRIHLAELSAGVNINPDSDPASQTNLSFETLVNRLIDGTYPSVGLSRVRAIIHPQTGDEERLILNLQRSIPSEREIKEGTASFVCSPSAMKIFGKDDFSPFFSTFITETHAIPIYSFLNDGEPTTIEKAIKTVLPEILDGFRGFEGNRRGIER
jgi:hypothetical protein